VKADIPRPLHIPRWVPTPVAMMARELARAGVARLARGDRSLLVASEADFQRHLRALTTNPRMKWVWRELGKRHGTGYLHPARQPKRPVADPQGLAMTALFFHALKIMRDVSSDEVLPANRKEVAAARAQCAAAAKTLRVVAWAKLEPPSDARAREDAGKFAAAADVLEDLARGHARGRRDRGNVAVRYVTGELARICRVTFRTPMYGVVATIAGVLLGDCDIPVSTIRSWHPRK
jgi:hypothetical protein